MDVSSSLRRARFVVLVLALLLVSACGGADRPTTEEFCSGLVELNETKGWKAKQKAGRRLRELGVPEGLPADAKEGFDIVLTKALRTRSDDELMRELDELSRADQQQVSAMGTYVAETCGEDGSESTPPKS